MSYCKESASGKDKIIFLTEEDAKKPSNIEFQKPREEPVGLITDEGDINWDCPCLGSMPSGPCGVEFREAFSCFHHSEAEPKGTDCLGKFMEMNDCMKRHPDLYPESAEDVEEEEEQEVDSEIVNENENTDGQIVESKS